MDYGVAQDRRRHFTIASKVGQVNFNTLNDDRHKIKRINDGKGGRPVLWAIADLIDVLDKEDAFNYPATHNKTNQGRIDWLFGETDWTPEEKRNLTEIKIPKENRMHTSYQHTYAQDVTKRDSRAITSIRQYMDGCTQTCHHQPSHAGLAHVGKEDLSTQRRRSLTPHEAARVQSFPDHFSFKEAPSVYSCKL